MTYKELTQCTHTRIIQTYNKYAVFLRASEDRDFPDWNKEADPMRWAVLWEEKEIAGHKIKTQSGRALDGEPRYILRADPDTGELTPYLNICEWRQSYFFPDPAALQACTTWATWAGGPTRGATRTLPPLVPLSTRIWTTPTV